MVLTGVLSIQMGDNPWILMEKIASFTGIVESRKFIEKLHEVAGEEEKAAEKNTKIDALLGGTPAENTQD